MNNINRHSRFAVPSFLLLATFLLPGLAQANVGVGSTQGWLHGFQHPLTGLDHLCAMIAVGLWAAQRGGKALWLAPLTFVSVMALGGALGIAGIAIPFVEGGIILSLLVLGVMVAAAVWLPMAASLAIIGLFAILHGHAHGSEMPVSASGISYGLGFLMATALLHGLGIGLAVCVAKLGQVRLVRLAGCAVALCGAYLWIA